MPTFNLLDYIGIPELWNKLDPFAASKYATTATATTTTAGLMSAADKTKLDSVGTVFTFKGSVADSTALPASGNAVGDAYAVEDTGTVSVWDGTAWVDLGQWDGMVPATSAQIDALFAA